jgi:hypothetical protein
MFKTKNTNKRQIPVKLQNSIPRGLGGFAPPTKPQTKITTKPGLSQAQASIKRKPLFQTTQITPSQPNTREITFPIDLVYTWVDGSDDEWLKIRKSFEPTQSNLTREASSEQRWRDLDELKYSVESALQFAPWIRKIFIISDHQRPYWFDENNPGKVVFVDHPQLYGEYEEHLPVFNSHSIETHLFRIPDLSEHFIYANDDTFFGNYTKPEDFFTYDGKFKVFLMEEYDMETERTFQTHVKEMNQRPQKNPKIPTKSVPQLPSQQFAVTPFITAQVHNNAVLDTVFGKSDIPRKRLKHQMRALKKSVFQFCWENEDMYVYLFNTSSTRFRSLTDIDTISLVSHAGLVLGEAVAGIISSKYYSLNNDPKTVKKIFYHLAKRRPAPKLYCINDDTDDPDVRLLECLQTGFEKFLPHKLVK